MWNFKELLEFENWFMDIYPVLFFWVPLRIRTSHWINSFITYTAAYYKMFCCPCQPCSLLSDCALCIVCLTNTQRARSVKEHSITPKHHTHKFIKYAVKKSRMHMNIEMNNVWLLLLATARSELNRLALAASFKELKMPIILFFFIISNVWHVPCLFINYLALKKTKGQHFNSGSCK